MPKIIHLIVGASLRFTARARLGHLVPPPLTAEIMLARSHEDDWQIERLGHKTGLLQMTLLGQPIAVVGEGV